MARKARTMVAKLRRQSRVRPYRERTEITPLLATTDKTNGTEMVNGKKCGKPNGTTIQIQNQLYPIEEDFVGKLVFLSPLIYVYDYTTEYLQYILIEK